MSEVKRYDLVYSDHMGAGIGVKPTGKYVKHEDYAEEKHRADQNASYLETLTERMLSAEKERDQATLTHYYQQDQIDYWNDISRQQAEENTALQQKLDAVLAENVALKSPEMVEFLRLVECMTGDHADSNYGASHEWIRHIFAQGQSFEEKYGDTPWGVTSKSKYVATDAILNEVRAKAQREFCQNFEHYGKVEPYHFDPDFADLYAKISKRIYDGILDNPTVHDMSSLVDWLEQGAADSRAYADMAIEHAAHLRTGSTDGGV